MKYSEAGMIPVTPSLDCRDPWEGAGSNEGKDRPAQTVSKVAPSVSDREDREKSTDTFPPSVIQSVLFFRLQ